MHSKFCKPIKKCFRGIDYEIVIENDKFTSKIDSSITINEYGNTISEVIEKMTININKLLGDD